jgi:hypothetical protein
LSELELDDCPDPDDLLEPDDFPDPDDALDPDSLERAYTDVWVLSRRLWRSHSATVPDLHLPLQ